MRNLSWFIGGNEQQKQLIRHPLNGRRQDTVLKEYIKSVQTRGIIKGVRGEAWVRAPATDSSESAYLALTFGTLLLGLSWSCAEL